MKENKVSPFEELLSAVTHTILFLVFLLQFISLIIVFLNTKSLIPKLYAFISTWEGDMKWFFNRDNTQQENSPGLQRKHYYYSTAVWMKPVCSNYRFTPPHSANHCVTLMLFVWKTFKTLRIHKYFTGSICRYLLICSFRDDWWQTR